MPMKTNFFQKIIKRPRLIVQLLFLAVTNGYLYGFATGRIYTGPTKTLCVPGLNCYSCPGALGSCPIGSLQAVLASRNYRFSFYVVGFLMLFGSVFGRFICGWLCPFGLVQDLLYRIPIPAPFKKWISKRKNLPGHRILVWAKYLILVGFVVILPLIAVDIIGQGSPWFCKYICPSGTLGAGIPLLLTNEPLRQAAGFLFQWKFAILVFLLILSVLISPILQIHLSVGRSVQPFQPYRTLSLSGTERFLHQMRKMPKSMRHGYPCLGNAQQSGMHPLRQLCESMPYRRASKELSQVCQSP